ncbi:MAG: DUF3318 domain-containing protein [Trinickia sp.]|jgi:hypothetical protein
MNEPTSRNSAHYRHSPVRDASTPQMRAVRKELLLLRAEVERAEFVQARAELHQKFSNFGWMRLIVPGLGAMRGKHGGRGVNAKITDWIFHHPLSSTLASLILGKPLRATVAAGAKPLLKWGGLAAAAYAGLRVWSRLSHKHDEAQRLDEANDERH